MFTNTSGSSLTEKHLNTSNGAEKRLEDTLALSPLMDYISTKRKDYMDKPCDVSCD